MEDAIMVNPSAIEWIVLGYNRKDVNCVQCTEPLATLVKKFLAGHFEQVLCFHMVSHLLEAKCETDILSPEEVLLCRVREFLSGSDEQWERQFLILLVGITSLQLFVQNNWSGPPTKEQPAEFIPLLKEQEIYVRTQLAVDEETIYLTLLYPEYLWVAKILLGSSINQLTNCETKSWWCIRYISIHQQVLRERCPSLFAIMSNELMQALEVINLLSTTTCQELIIQLYVEAFYILSYYYEHARAKDCLLKAQRMSGLNMNLTGALGRRTRFQQKDVAQLILEVQHDQLCRNAISLSLDEDIDIKSDERMVLPVDIQINDDVRLETIAFTDEQNAPKLSVMDQIIVLGLYSQIQRANAFHSLVKEELMTYLVALLSNPKDWTIQSSSLLQRSKLESESSRSLERSMMQIQALVNQHQVEKPPVRFRLKMIYCTPFPPLCILEKELASMFIKLGAISSALDVYLRLQMWDDAVACYLLLQKRDKAEALVRQQLAVQETPTLWCYLGDATDNPDCFLKAWELSNHRSARAQRALGLLYFRKKEYETCVSHFEKSVEINRMQLDAWFRLAYAALQVENWETAAKAYRACVQMDPNNFEAWNNLANAYIKLNQKFRAWRTLQEALRCHYEDWRIWENYMLVSIDCRVFAEGIKAYHRILDLKEKHVDEEVLEILVQAVIKGIEDDQVKVASMLFPQLSELFGRITAQVTSNSKIWRLYGALVSTLDSSTEEMLYRVVQYFQKAHRCAMQTSNWENSKSCQEVLDLSCDLADAYLRASAESSATVAWNFLSAAKFALTSTLAKIRQYEGSIFSSRLPGPQPEVRALEVKMQEVNERLAVLR